MNVQEARFVVNTTRDFGILDSLPGYGMGRTYIGKLGFDKNTDASHPCYIQIVEHQYQLERDIYIYVYISITYNVSIIFSAKLMGIVFKGRRQSVKTHIIPMSFAS